MRMLYISIEYAAFTRGLFLGVLLRRADAEKSRSVNALIEDLIVSRVPPAMRMRGRGKIEVFCPPPEDLRPRVLRKEMCPFLPLFVRTAMQLTLPRWACALLIPRGRLLADHELRILARCSEPDAQRAYAGAFEYGAAPREGEEAGRGWLRRCWARAAAAADALLSRLLPGRGALMDAVRRANCYATGWGQGNPSACMVSNAGSLARVGAAMLAEGGPLISAEGLEAALRCESRDFDDRFVGHAVEYSACGLARRPFLYEPDLDDFYGWYGIDGGALVVSPARGLAFAYLPTAFEGRPRRVRSLRLLRACLGALEPGGDGDERAPLLPRR